MTIFGEDYAGMYDQLYADKNYERECEFVLAHLENRFHQPLRLLDLGCGTGGHAQYLANQGHKVTGIDISQSMLDLAVEKISPSENQPEYFCSDIRDFKLDKTFDAAIMMFAVLGYQLSNEDVERTLFNVREHLELGAPFVFDFWFGPAVLAQRPEQRIRRVDTKTGPALRVVEPSLDVLSQNCTVKYTLWQPMENLGVKETIESHSMRFFFAQEVQHFLNQAGFELTSITDFEDFKSEPSTSTWNVICSAKAI